MSIVSPKLFYNYPHALATKLINFSSDTFKVMLVTGATAPNVATASVYADISANEVASGNGYTTGGATVPGTGTSNSAGIESQAGNAVTWTASGAGFTFQWVVLYDVTASNTLIQLYDYGSPLTLNGANGDTFTWSPLKSLIGVMNPFGS